MSSAHPIFAFPIFKDRDCTTAVESLRMDLPWTPMETRLDSDMALEGFGVDVPGGTCLHFQNDGCFLCFRYEMIWYMCMHSLYMLLLCPVICVVCLGLFFSFATVLLTSCWLVGSPHSLASDSLDPYKHLQCLHLPSTCSSFQRFRLTPVEVAVN